MVSIGICDDSEIELTLLKNFIDKQFWEKKLEYIIYTFTSGEELVAYYQEHTLDLLFLDIYMKQLDGIETGRAIRALDKRVEIIFCTASSSYALESYDLLASGYLVKPFDPEKLRILVDRFIEARPRSEHRYLVVKSNYNNRVIDLNDIVHVESDDKVLMIYTVDGEEIRTYGKLNDIEQKLDTPNFLRCHQSFIINMAEIKSVEDNDFMTTTGRLIPIRKRELRKIKNEYLEYKKKR